MPTISQAVELCLQGLMKKSSGHRWFVALQLQTSSEQPVSLPPVCCIAGAGPCWHSTCWGLSLGPWEQHREQGLGLTFPCRRWPRRQQHVLLGSLQSEKHSLERKALLLLNTLPWSSYWPGVVFTCIRSLILHVKLQVTELFIQELWSLPVDFLHKYWRSWDLSCGMNVQFLLSLCRSHVVLW